MKPNQIIGQLVSLCERRTDKSLSLAEFVLTKFGKSGIVKVEVISYPVLQLSTKTDFGSEGNIQ